MSAPAIDGQLAWAISSWSGPDSPNPLSREDVESLTRHLTAAGFGKPEDGGELSLGDLRKLATKAKTSLTEFIKETGATTA